ncbi:MAG: ABC transporter permease [Synergistaceae bacterium]|jgi:simple sugar transport system permease protein|nr:ABC transporter permease [Synergistaceae bacterium]
MKSSMKSRLRLFLIENAVVILFIVLIAIAIPASRLPGSFLLQEILTRLGRSSFLVIALLLPIMAGMGLNFGMVLGAMAGQIGLIFVMDWGIVGIPGLLLAMLLSLPISILLGWLCGSIMNMAKGREMVTGFILGFFMNGVYMLFALYAMGSIIPVTNPELLLSRGYGIRNVVDLESVRQALERFIPLKVWGVNIPVLNYLFIAAVSAFIVWFRKTKLGQDMRAVGQDRAVAGATGIAVERTRIIAIIISTVLAGFGQIIFLQNLGTINTTNSHEQTGMFSIASLLIGGASVTKASIPNALVGVILFHLLFLVAPMAGKNLIGSGMLGEYFRQFVSYGVIALSLVLYEWKRAAQEDDARALLRGGAGSDDGKGGTL